MPNVEQRSLEECCDEWEKISGNYACGDCPVRVVCLIFYDATELSRLVLLRLKQARVKMYST